MDSKEFLTKLDEIVMADPGTVNEGSVLSDLDGWDSLAKVQFQALLDQEFGKQIEPDRIAKCNTVRDLMALAGIAAGGTV